MDALVRTRARSGLLWAATLSATIAMAAPSCGGGATGTGGASGTGGTDGGGPDAAAPGVPLEQGSPWPKFRGGVAQDGRSAVKPSLSGGAQWSFPTGRGIFSSPIVAADGTVYVGSADRTFYALTPAGKLRWSLLTGEIIDSAGLLDDQGRVYFGSGDGNLRALDAKTGAVAWTMAADQPSSNAFINWFEGNVAIGPKGTLYVPNDNHFVYAVDRTKGSVAWKYSMPDQTWSLPAVDVKSGVLYVGNNNLLPLLGKNTFSINPDGSTNWETSSLGTVAASPVLTADGKVILGGFDGYVRAYDAASGDMLWQAATRDHVYASAALLPDGTIIAPSCDGTVYALDPKDGSVKWTFDTSQPVRSSPAVDRDGNVYMGLGDGRLLVLNPDGTLRWAMQLIDADRNDLNSSPALGSDAIYLGGESGELFSVPYDYCLRPMSKSDARCSTTGGDGLPEGVNLIFTTAFGALSTTPPTTIDKNQALTFTLLVRPKGTSELAILDSSTVEVTVTPPSAVSVDLSGDGKFLTISPQTTYAAASDGTVQVSITGQYLTNLDRKGLALSGGTVGGDVSAMFSFTLRPDESYALPLPVPQQPGDPAGVWEVSRLALPLPTILPSYNQIGFDSLLYLVGIVEGSGNTGVAWMAGAKPETAQNVAVIDPATKALIPLALSYDAGVLTLKNQDGLTVEVMNAVIPFTSFRIAVHLGSDGSATEGVRLNGSTVCAGVPVYGAFLEQLGLCNPQTDVLSVFGGANFVPYQGGTQAAPSGVGAVVFSATTDTVSATITGSSLKLAEHVAAILLVDAVAGTPVTLNYGTDTMRTAAPDGTLTGVSVPRGSKMLPAMVRAYLMIDTYPAAVTTLALP